MAKIRVAFNQDGWPLISSIRGDNEPDITKEEAQEIIINEYPLDPINTLFITPHLTIAEIQYFKGLISVGKTPFYNWATTSYEGRPDADRVIYLGTRYPYITTVPAIDGP